MNRDPVPASPAPSGRLVAIVLAGGDRDDRLARSVGAPSKALVPLRDAPMGAYVATALRASGVVDDVVWVGPTDGWVRRLVDVALPAGNRLVDSLTLGLGAAMGRDPSARYLIVTADVPWWDADGVRAFVQRAPVADLVYPVVAEATALARFPDQKRTFVRLADGRFTGGNAVLLASDAVPALLPFVDLAYEARKHPFALARRVGWGRSSPSPWAGRGSPGSRRGCRRCSRSTRASSCPTTPRSPPTSTTPSTSRRRSVCGRSPSLPPSARRLRRSPARSHRRRTPGTAPAAPSPRPAA